MGFNSAFKGLMLRMVRNLQKDQNCKSEGIGAAFLDTEKRG